MAHTSLVAMDRLVGTTPVPDRIVEAASLGLSRRAQAKAAAISIATLMAWFATARTARGALELDPDWPLDPNTRRCLELLERVERAEGEAVLVRVARITRAASTGGKRKRTTSVTRTETVDGKPVTTTTVTTEEVEMPPDWRADAFLLERNHPGEFGPTVGLVERDARPDDEVADGIADALRGVLEVEGRELPPSP